MGTTESKSQLYSNVIKTSTYKGEISPISVIQFEHLAMQHMPLMQSQLQFTFCGTTYQPISAFAILHC